MKRKTVGFVAFAILLLVTASAQGAAVGYLNFSFQAGDNWFGNPLLNTNSSLSTIIPSAPVGTTVSLLNGPTATWNGATWSSELVLNPGTGAILHTPSAFINTFVGTVLNFSGGLWNGNDLPMPPPFAGADGVYLFSSKAPAALSGHVFDDSQGLHDVFSSILGRAPHEGEQVTTLNALSQTYFTTTFLNGAWNNGDPSLGPGQAALFNIGPVPEPSVGVLLAAGVALGGAVRKRLRERTEPVRA